MTKLETVRIQSKRTAIALFVVGALWLVFAWLVAPKLIGLAYEGRAPLEFLNGIIEGQSTHALGHYLGIWTRFAGVTLLCVGVAIAAFLGMPREKFYRRNVATGSATRLAMVRITVCTLLFLNTCWEDLPSSAAIPREFIREMGIIELLYGVPGFDAFTTSAPALLGWQIVTGVLLVLAALGIWSRLTVPLAAIGAIVMGGLLRQYSHLFHTMLLPMLLLVALAFMRCADRLSIDARAGRARSELADRHPDYAWSSFIIISIVAVIYTATGSSKLQVGGLDWWSGSTLKGYILADGLGNQQFDWGLGLHLVDISPELLSPFAFLAVFGEAAFVLVIVSRWARLVLPLLMLGMHLCIFLLMNILFIDLITILVVVFILPTLKDLRESRGQRAIPHAPDVPGSEWPGRTGRLPLIAAGVFSAMFLAAVTRLEFYPLSGWQMYALKNESGVVIIERAFSYRASGREEPAPFETCIRALADGRFQDNLGYAFERDHQHAFREYMDTCAQRANRDSSDPIVRFVVERRVWEYEQTPARGRDSGRLVASFEHRVRGRGSVRGVE